MFAGGEVSEILQEVDLPLISAQQCDKVLTTLKIASMDETMTCAGFPEGGRDACQVHHHSYCKMRHLTLLT